MIVSLTFIIFLILFSLSLSPDVIGVCVSAAELGSVTVRSSNKKVVKDYIIKREIIFALFFRYQRETSLYLIKVDEALYAQFGEHR